MHSDPSADPLPIELHASAEGLHARLIRQLYQALRVPSALGPTEISAHAQIAVAALNEIRPRTETEGMLAIQMIVTHMRAMDCLRRAADPDAPGESRERQSREAQRLMTLHLRQLDAFERHRARNKPVESYSFLADTEASRREFDELLREWLVPPQEENATACDPAPAPSSCAEGLPVPDSNLTSPALPGPAASEPSAPPDARRPRRTRAAYDNVDAAKGWIHEPGGWETA